jgi:hypothetical protein
MPDTRSHRGPHPDDARLFGATALPVLRQAAADYVWLLNRAYPPAASLSLVGNQFELDRRQRMAVARFACTDAQSNNRRNRETNTPQPSGKILWLDGFNVLTTIEAALAGAVVLAGRDGSFRDLAGMHGTYRKVEETLPAILLVGQTLADYGVGLCRWYLDSPVSNSGRLKTILLKLATERNWPWEVELANNPDAALKQTAHPVATADSVILDACGPWVNLARMVIEKHIPQAWIVDLEPVHRVC